MKLIAIFAAWICLIHGCQATICQKDLVQILSNLRSSFIKPTQCDCVNLVYIDRPTDIKQCYSKAKFVNQILLNFNTVTSRLHSNNTKCDFSDYQKLVHEMKTRTLAIVEAYFSCTESDCTSTVMAAYNKFADYRSKVFNVYTKCSFTTYSPECAQILIQARPPVYASAENILVALLACSELKADSLKGNGHTQYNFGGFDYTPIGFRECNCVKIDPRPIPKDGTECYSKKFISTLRKFVLINFDRIQATYHTNKLSHPECTYDALEKDIKQFKEFTTELPDLLEKDSPKFVDIDAYIKRYIALLVPYGPDVRNYILENNKTCYFPVRQSRITLLAIIDAVIGVLTKCVGYRDTLDKRC